MLLYIKPINALVIYYLFIWLTAFYVAELVYIVVA